MKFKRIKSSKIAIKKWVSLSFVVMALFVLSSCGTIVDTENKNITIDVGDKIMNCTILCRQYKKGTMAV